MNAKSKSVDFRKIIFFQDIFAQPPPQGASKIEYPERILSYPGYCSCGGLVGKVSLIEARGGCRFIVEVRGGALSPLI